MSDEDDWFERGIREDAPDDPEDPEDVDAPDTSDDPDDPEDLEGSENPGDPDEDARDDTGDVSNGGADTGDSTDRESDPERGQNTDPASGQSADPFEQPPEHSGNGNPFEEDFASALENAPGPGGGDSSQVGGDGPPSLPGGDGAFEDFGDAPGGFDESAFDEGSFESDLERLDIGIEGLDKMILGGVPRRSLMVAIGSAGTGKTTFGLQFLNHGLERGESGVYITLEESYDRILSTANEKGWDFESYVEDEQLAVVDIDPVEMANSLDSIQNELPELIEAFGADRLVLDSVSLLEMMYEHTPKRRSQVFGFARALKNAGVTTLLTSEASEDNPYASRFGIVEYLADAVFVLQYVRESDFRETRLAIEIQKIRDANHSRATKPYELTESGISVYRQANIF
ncbi:KaiC domain-containing protein [Halobellus captivus]|uniref:KaiC domain-containing protein n=1 Tax=Halobellus captivus TaxID=2592614 RepID=UPI0011A64A86|nr:KaiC domain-containing protein [Halobellus captivus]